MLRFKQLILPLLMFACIGAACSSDEEGIISPAEGYEVCLRVSQPATRTALGEASDTEQAIKWSKGDKFLLWAYPEGSQNATIDAATFTQYVYSTDSYSTSDFTATLNAPMSKGTYNYYATYPIPENRDETKVTYTLPATQTGVYDPNLDVMVASTRGNALLARTTTSTEITWEEPTISFSHLFHLIRIRIPEGKNNLGLPIKRLEITFPQEVVGTVTFDVKDPTETAQWTNLSNKITVDLADGNEIDAGNGYVWLYVKPGTLNGSISFKAYDEAGVPSGTISTEVAKTLVGQKVTPIALTVPASPLAPITYINIAEVANNLGEDWQTMTISGYNFLVPYTATTTSTKVFTPETSKNYKVAICASASSLQGKSLPLQYESEHTLFSDPVTLPSSLSQTTWNKVKKIVPYLLYENFSGLTTSFESGTVHKTSDAGEYDAISLAQYGLNDWYAARVGGGAGKNIRICSRIEMGLFVTNRNTGRVDTPVLSKLKVNANAKIKVEYNYAGDRYEAVGSGGYPVYSAGTSANVVTAGDDEIENVVVSGVQLAIDGPNVSGTYYGNTPHYASFTASSCNNTTRVCWYLTNNRSASVGGNGMYWLYLDKIKVSISK